MTLKNIKDLTKKQKITVIVVAIVVALALCAGIIALVASLGKSPYTIDGVYKWTVSYENEMYSQYTFTDSTVTRVYDYGNDIITETFTYEIKTKGNEKTITFVNVDTGEVEGPLTYSEETDKGGKIKSIIINGVWYERQ